MDTNDWKTMFAESCQQMAEALDQVEDPRAAAKLGEILQNVMELQEKLFCDLEQNQSDIDQNSATPP